MTELSTITIAATGGTIAGKAEDKTLAGEYRSGVFRVEELLGALPDLEKEATIRTEQIASVGSENITEEILLSIRSRVAAILAEPDTDGVVILHGTDTMEETACFLDLTLEQGKPVVLTGAMRPANAVGADGPANILSAVRLASDPGTANRGVLVVLNDRIFAARDAVKVNAVELDAFAAPGFGPLGRMNGTKPLWFRSRRKLSIPPFSLDNVTELPRVEIVYGHTGQRPELVKAALAAGARGIVFAGVGAANIHEAVKPILLEAVQSGIPVVAASRCVNGVPGMGSGELVYACGLNPQKARILLQLALTQMTSPKHIQTLFALYAYESMP